MGGEARRSLLGEKKKKKKFEFSIPFPGCRRTEIGRAFKKTRRKKERIPSSIFPNASNKVQDLDDIHTHTHICIYVYRIEETRYRGFNERTGQIPRKTDSNNIAGCSSFTVACATTLLSVNARKTEKVSRIANRPRSSSNRDGRRKDLRSPYSRGPPYYESSPILPNLESVNRTKLFSRQLFLFFSF